MGADPDGDRGLRHLAPTYTSRDTRDLSSDGHRGFAILSLARSPAFCLSLSAKLAMRPAILY